jgi:hypothetical protein
MRRRRPIHAAPRRWWLPTCARCATAGRSHTSWIVSEGIEGVDGPHAPSSATLTTAIVADLEQLGREPDPSDSPRNGELAGHREPAHQEALRGDHKPGPLGSHRRPDPYAYLRDVLERLPTQPASRIGELLPHRWQLARFVLNDRCCLRGATRRAAHEASYHAVKSMTVIFDLPVLPWLFLLEGSTLLLSLVAVAGIPVGILAAALGRAKVAAAAACGAMFLIALVLLLAVTVSPRIWQIVHGVYLTSSPARQAVLAADLRQHWDRTFEEMRAVDWYFMAHRWDVCHELWPQLSCTHAPVSEEAEGIVREVLSQIAHPEWHDQSRRAASPDRPAK